MESPVLHATRSSGPPRRRSYPIGLRIDTADKVIAKIWTYDRAHGETGAAVGSIQRWVTQRKTDTYMYENPGQPRYIDENELTEVLDEVKKKSKGPVLPGKRAFGTMLQNGADNTSANHNKPLRHLSPHYINAIGKENGVFEVNAEVIDQAHEVALNDPRHALSFAVMHHYLRTKISNDFFVTFDKTRFDLLRNTQNTAKAIRVGPRGKTTKTGRTNKSTSETNCSVHLYMVVNDSGKLADLVYLVTRDKMPKDTIDVHRAPVLDCSNSLGSTAYLIFLGKSTSNKDASLEWLVYNIVIPFIDGLRASVVNGVSKAVNLQIDGDPRQLQVMTDPDVMQSLRYRNIVVTKSSASCTPTQAPLDEGHAFLTPKTYFRDLVNKGYKPVNPQVEADLREIFREHLRRYPRKYTAGGMPSMELGNYFTSVIRCLYTAVAALRKSGVSALIRDAFLTTGVSPYSPTIIRNKCQFEFTDAQKEEFVNAIPALSKIFESNFELKEKDFDDAGIPSNNTSRDELAVHRRRALLLYAPHVLADLAKQATDGGRK